MKQAVRTLPLLENHYIGELHRISKKFKNIMR